MIPAIHQIGSDTTGLIKYLFGPGRAEAHTEPRLVAAWTGAPHLDALTLLGSTDPAGLAARLDAPALLTGRNPTNHVWHCSVRLHPTDPVLNDTTWAAIARTFIDAVAIAPADDPAAARWAALRHADDHIHLVATLYRQDGRRMRPSHDRTRAQDCARALEDHLDLYRLGPREGTAPRATLRTETAKARRTGHARPARDEIRLRVRTALAAAADPAEFLDRLTESRLLVRTRHRGGTIVGYTAAIPDVTTADGYPVQYAGGSLAADLTWPKVRDRLAHTIPTRTGPLEEHAEAALHAAATAEPSQDALPSAAADLLYSTAAHTPPDDADRIRTAAEWLDRAARCPHGTQTAPGPAATLLRGLARRLARTLPAPGTLALAGPITRVIGDLADRLAALRRDEHRPAQERAATRAAALLTEPHTIRPADSPAPPAGTSNRRRTNTNGDRHGRTTQRHRR